MHVKTSSCISLFFVWICHNLVRKRPWSKEEKEAVLRHLRRFILDSRLPGKEAIELCKEKEQHILDGRSWRNIKDFCRNAVLASRKKTRLDAVVVRTVYNTDK